MNFRTLFDYCTSWFTAPKKPIQNDKPISNTNFDSSVMDDDENDDYLCNDLVIVNITDKEIEEHARDEADVNNGKPNNLNYGHVKYFKFDINSDENINFADYGNFSDLLAKKSAF